MVDENPEAYCLAIRDSLINKTYPTSRYEIFNLVDKGKEREIHKLPYYPDRIVHWAIMIQIEDMFMKHFIRQTYAALPGRGIHNALNQLLKYRENASGNMYCLKFDVKKFFPSIDKGILKMLLRKKIKDQDLLWLLDDVIDSSQSGVPIGNYLSQYFGNFYLSFFDHWMKEEKGIKCYLRYMDDVVILHDDKDFLHELLEEVHSYMQINLNLRLKENYQIFPPKVRGVDFVGYRVFKDYILLRKTTSKRLIKQMKRIRKKCERGEYLTYNEYCSINSYKGWILYCSGFNLTQKYIQPLEKYVDLYHRKFILLEEG